MFLSCYGHTGHWHYLALSGLMLVALGVQTFAWWIAAARKRQTLAIWLIAYAQILAMVIAPLFVAEHWRIGILLLALVPIEIGIVDEIRRIPLFIVLSLLGAAGMVSLDILDLSNRITILVTRPDIVLFLNGVILITLCILGFMLWHLRLRTREDHRVQFDIATQQALVFMAISALSILIVVGVLIHQIRESQVTQVGQNFQTLAQINVERVRNTLEQQIDILINLGRQEPAIQEGLVVANASYPPEDILPTEELLAEREQRWLSAPEGNEFVLRYRSNPQTIAFNNFRSTNLLHTNLILTDENGGLVAAQGDRPYGFSYQDKTWWKQAWNSGLGGVYIGDLTIEKETGDATLFIAVGVINPKNNQTIGVLASTYQLRGIQQTISLVQTQIEGNMFLVNANGQVIAATDDTIVGRFLPNYSASGLTGDHSGLVHPYAGWLLEKDYQEQSSVIAYVALNSATVSKIDPLRALEWNIVVSDTQQNALAGVTRSTKIASLVGLVILALVIIATNSVTRVITKPIEALTRTAADISAGNLEQRAQPVGPVELVTLAESFNTLTERLRSLINNLQDQVAQRTMQLEDRVQELQTITTRLQNELDLARNIQQSLLPPPTASGYNLKIVCHTQPARDVGGDFYSYHMLDDNRVAVAVGDVSGKGVSAALLMAASLSLFNSFVSRDHSPGEHLTQLDRALIPYTRPYRQNCALCYTMFHDNKLWAVNAGCIPPYIRRYNGTVEFLEIGGLALGQNVTQHTEYQEVCVSLSIGDIVILTSDGVVEAMNGTGDMFGFDRLEQTIAAFPNSGAESMLAHVRDTVTTFVGQRDLHDDMTIVVIEVQQS